MTADGRPSWDDYFLFIAQVVASRADCSRRRVGAVLVSPDHRIVSTGYNGTIPGAPGCLSGACPRAASDVAPGSSYDTGPGACIALHAEQNAVLYSRREDRQGATLYITDAPCDGCKRLVAGAGIREVIWPDGRMLLG